MKKKARPVALTSAQDRVRWLLDNRYGGSRAAMAAATKVSLTAIVKVVSGQQAPGRRLLETLAANSEVNPAWLLVGEGAPFRGTAVPVASQCLLGPPSMHPDAITGERVTETDVIYSPTRYWLMLTANEPATRVTGTGLRVGDTLLMETDRATYPALEQMNDRWVVVKLPRLKGIVARLAQACYYPAGESESEVLEVDTHEDHPVAGRRFVLDELPEGGWRVDERKVYYAQPTEPKGKGTPEAWRASILPRAVKMDDIVAVCVLVIRRFG